VFEPLSYLWTSTCSGDCFVLAQSTWSSIHKAIIHSTDSGNHSCMVTDDVGNTGSASIEMNVVGEILFRQSKADNCVLLLQ